MTRQQISTESEPGQELVPGLATLARERLPERDLWPAIASRVQAPARRRAVLRNSWGYGLAASIAVAVLTTAVLRPALPVISTAASPPAAGELAVIDSSQRGNTPYSNGDEHQAHTVPALSLKSLRTLRSESLDNASVLVAERAESAALYKATFSKASRRNAYSQEAILRANLRLISQAEREVRRALRTDPDSEMLNSLLAIAQEKREQVTALLVHEKD